MGFKATINLLNASTLVAISGAFRLFIAVLFLGAEPRFLAYIAGGLVIYTIYTLDRALECKEDAVNRSELTGSRKDIAFFVSISAFVFGTFILFKEMLYFLPFLPLAVGYLYSKGIKIGGFNLKLKGGLGVKNLVVALTWGAFITGIAGKSVDNIIPLIFVFIFFSSKVFINSIIYDFKDVKGDSLVGIRTLPVQLGEKKTVVFLLILHIIIHLGMFVAIIMGFIAFEPIILLYSFTAGIICINYYSIATEIESKARKLIREFLIDGESTTEVSLRLLINSLFLQHALYSI
ncbi:MAG: UbiA family prenyltransferase [Candidatus Methanoperedens sp.]|nr:UbiA family prenyltransferase [Candidatus Methanoperedens sp.]MCZ7384247.1 UbiA family prenyltransferase [Candidatus Methanoperedens sp.]